MSPFRRSSSVSTASRCSGETFARQHGLQRRGQRLSALDRTRLPAGSRESRQVLPRAPRAPALARVRLPPGARTRSRAGLRATFAWGCTPYECSVPMSVWYRSSRGPCADDRARTEVWVVGRIFSHSLLLLRRGRVPDGRRVGALLDRWLAHLRATAGCCAPNRRCSNVALGFRERARSKRPSLSGSKSGIGPHHAQLRVADVVRPGGLLRVYRVAHWRQLAGLRDRACDRPTRRLRRSSPPGSRSAGCSTP